MDSTMMSPFDTCERHSDAFAVEPVLEMIGQIGS